MRNDHQDALSAGLAVNEYAPASKSADEIRGLWHWIETRLNVGATIQDELTVSELLDSPPTAMFLETPAESVALIS
jgi:chromosome partitioning protein